MNLKLKLLDKRLMPTRAHQGDAGIDLRARIEGAVTFSKGKRQTIPTGVHIEIPHGYVGLVCPRSGLARKHGLTVTNSPGIIDSGYKGEVCAIMQMNGDDPVDILPFDRIAQLVIVPVVYFDVDLVDSLEDSARGENGFGSSGVA